MGNGMMYFLKWQGNPLSKKYSARERLAKVNQYETISTEQKNGNHDRCR